MSSCADENSLNSSTSCLSLARSRVTSPLTGCIPTVCLMQDVQSLLKRCVCVRHPGEAPSLALHRSSPLFLASIQVGCFQPSKLIAARQRARPCQMGSGACQQHHVTPDAYEEALPSSPNVSAILGAPSFFNVSPPARPAGTLSSLWMSRGGEHWKSSRGGHNARPLMTGNPT